MAKSRAIWGIDIGQSALKALRCRPSDGDPKKVVAESFDYIEYPKILSQPEADAESLVRDALTQFLSRNDLTNDRVAISVSGQSGLARFIKLPPVEAKKIPDIVKYEARQQIPFALEDVVWDYQKMAGGGEDDGFALETEVGLFAMKRDQVFRALRPFDEAGIAVDIIQLSPLAIYNYTVFDHFSDLPPVDEFDPENPPPSMVVLSLGTDTTDLVITNGYRVWQRSIPIGGSHFTKALTKELRLTFSKAEHLKRNARQAENAKALFQAMRPVFSDLLSEIQRSIGFFTSLDRNAKIGRVLALGNAMKLPGLVRYLSQNLEQDVKPIQSFSSLESDSVVDSPQFKSNVLSFGPAYGLCLQGMGRGSIGTNLLPKEIVTDRLIRAKKPWVIGAIAATLLGCTINFFGVWNASMKADLTTNDDLKKAQTAVENVERISKDFISQYEEAKTSRENIDQRGESLVSNVEGRLNWLRLLKIIDTCLPKHDKSADSVEPGPVSADVKVPAEVPKDPKEFAEWAKADAERKRQEISARTEIHVLAIDSEYLDDLQPWFASIDKRYRENHGLEAKTDETPDGADANGVSEYADDGAGADPYGALNDDLGIDPSGAVSGGSGESGYVVQITGYHYHNLESGNSRAEFVINSFLSKLKDGKVKIASVDSDELEEVWISDLGVSHPVLVRELSTDVEPIPNRDAIAEYERLGRKLLENVNSGAAKQNQLLQEPPEITLRKFMVIVQFAWQPTNPRGKRSSRTGYEFDTSIQAAEPKWPASNRAT